jgi:hypothetical protein
MCFCGEVLLCLRTDAGMCFDCLTGNGGRGVHVPSHDTFSSSPSLPSPPDPPAADCKAGWLLKRDKKKFMVMSSERVFCLLKGGVLFYFSKQKVDPKNSETGLLSFSFLSAQQPQIQITLARQILLEPLAK